ncbi:hypothetical protein ASG67_06475 [Sphingomonas sp. Leaf339]|uniref:helix-turn-helix domain-containing protein n=1 Tax=Sphingomonas sp. Leaf339 TaxID=1736343 RepID=UPI0006F5E615|nr:helix-turn-helix transcriptional regulator [Sphingomonas sp. Leaf339]KQU55762.1 hypothetical protein ASG67_06475 [Sphingomonas sp. Leaf339]
MTVTHAGDGGESYIMYEELASRNASLEPLCAWAQYDLRARFIVDQELSIVWINDAANRIIDDHNIMSRDSGRLTFSSKTITKRYLTMIDQSKPRQVPASMCIGANDDHYVLLTAINIGTTARCFTGISMRSSAHGIGFSDEVLRDTFHLTTMERRILECLVSGNTANEVSWLLMISLGTVRVHIRHIYEKLDVSSREPLFNKVLYLVER